MSLQTPGLFFFPLLPCASLKPARTIGHFMCKDKLGFLHNQYAYNSPWNVPSLLTPYELQDHRHSTSQALWLWQARLPKWPNLLHTSLVFIDTLWGAYMKNLTFHCLSVDPATPTVQPPLPRPLVNYTLQVLKSQWRTELALTVSFSFFLVFFFF